MTKKLYSLLVLCFLLLLTAGCGGKQEAAKVATNSSPAPQNSNTVTIGFIAGSQSSPQAVIAQENNLFAAELKGTGKQVKLDPTRSLDNVWPLMDKEKWDFAYIPSGNFGTYVTKTSHFGGSDKYIILAGSLNVNSNLLVTKPEIKTLKDLAGKKVSIANLRYYDEYMLNKLLAPEGLATDTAGGNVQLVWDDIVPKQLTNWSQGKYDGVIIYSTDNTPTFLEKIKGSKVLMDLNDKQNMGQDAPKYWLIARKTLVQSDPELVKKVLKAHILLTENATANRAKLPEISRRVYLKYWQDRNAKMDDIIKKNPIELYQKKWKKGTFSWDPNVQVATEFFNMLDKKGLVKGQTVEGFINIQPLNQVLTEMNKPVIK
ncbi:MAG TPA: ABC transporter substrate-binding protein [Bacillota bacterium]|nr:ABC transporter substrate-binding protein [Bacillota bacterium]